MPRGRSIWEFGGERLLETTRISFVAGMEIELGWGWGTSIAEDDDDDAFTEEANLEEKEGKEPFWKLLQKVPKGFWRAKYLCQRGLSLFVKKET